VSTHEDLRAAIDSKGKKYGNLEKPLVVAVNVLDDFCDEFAVWNALLGDEAMISTRQVEGSFPPEWERLPNGAWRGREGPRNKLVSAVSIVHQLLPSNLRTRSLTLIHNPWALNPLPVGALLVPYLEISLTDDKIHRREGRDHADVMGIPDPWPQKD
jgi:hypothetical protein